jgi:hypothetical protein
MVLACSVCTAPVQASVAPRPPVITIVQPTHSSLARLYTTAELDEMRQSYSSLDDHDVPEQEAPWAMPDAVYAGTAPTMRAPRPTVGGTTQPMVWPTTAIGMPDPRFGWEE